MTTATRSTKATRLPNLTDDPGFSEASDRHLRVQVDLNAIDQRINEIQGGINSTSAMRPKTRDHLEEAALAYLDGNDPSDAKLLSLQAELRELYKKRTVLLRAEEITRRERDELIGKTARALFAKIKPEHDEIAREIAIKAAELAEVVERYNAFRDAVEGAGLSAGLSSLEVLSGPVRKMVRRATGYPMDLGGAGRAAAWAVRVGAISKRDADKLVGFEYTESSWGL
jgi:hypothetical protein